MMTPPLGRTTLPLAAPVDCGAKVTLNVRLCLGAKYTGRLSPLSVNPVPVPWAWASMIVVVPELVTTTGNVELDPTDTLPNAKVDGFGVRESLPTPMAPTLTYTVLLDALLTKEIAPPVHPITVGVNVTIKLTSCPAGRTKGRPESATLNSGLLALIAEIVTLVDPVLVRVTGRASLWPTPMLPNRRRGTLVVNWGVPPPALLEIKPKNRSKLMG